MKTKIENVRIFDGDAAVLENSAVLFDESGILAVGAAAAAAAADRTVDGTGKTLLPGLIDCHVHLGSLGAMDAPDDPMASAAVTAAEASSVWRWGMTTMRCLGNGDDADIRVRDLIRAGKIPGCRILASGRGIAITGGHGWQMSHECDTVDQVVTAARTQLKHGADVIKFLATGGMATKGSNPNVAQLTEAQMRAGVEEAEAVGALTAAHCTSLEGARRAILAGVRSIEHARLDLPTAELMKEHGAYWVPTIITRYQILHTEDPALQYMRKKANPQDLVEKKRALNLCKTLGVPICCGTDAGFGTLAPLGKSIHTELAIYVEYGLTPMEALRSACRTAAEMLRIDESTGTVAVGRQADLVLVGGDPLADIHDTEKVVRTYQGGRLVYNAESGVCG